MADLVQLRQADVLLSKCGRPISPPGVSCVDIPKRYYYTKYFQVPAAAPPYPPDTNEAIEISGDTDFMLKSMSGLSWVPAANSLLGLMYFQIQYPSGRYEQNLLSDLVSDAGFGSGRMIFVNPIKCPPGSKIFITLDASIAGFGWSSFPGGGFTVSLMFEGALRYQLKPSGSTPAASRNSADSAAQLPRYFFHTPNQNILAPEWMVSGHDGEQCRLETPKGYWDDAFTYSNSDVPAVFSQAFPVATTINIQIQQSSDFLARRIMFNAVAGPGSLSVSPTFFVRLRTSLGGSAYTNDYVPANNMRIHRDWYLRHGVQVYIDVYAISNGGEETTTLYVYLEGAKRLPIGVAA